MRKSLIVCMLLMMAGPTLAAALQSDNFNGDTLNSQWSTYGTGGSVSVSGGKLNISGVYNGAASDAQQKGIESATGYVLSGDFEVVFDLTVDSYSTNGDGLIIALGIIKSGSQYLSAQHRKAGSGNWYELGLRTGQTNIQFNSGQEDVMYRFRREGSIAYWDFGVGTDSWSTLGTLSTFGTDDATFQLGTYVLKSGANLALSVDSVTVPEPMTMSLMAAGGVALLVRRKRK